MPTVNYSPVPSVEPAVTPPSTFQTIQPTPNAFGAAQGQALSNLGQTFERAGSQLADVAIQRQHLFNQVAAADASTKWQDATSKILYGDPDNPADVGFYGLKGDAAMRQFPVVRKQLDDLLKEHRSSLQNPMQQVLFDQETRRLRSYLMSETGRHYDQENSRWTQSVYKGQTEQALQNGARAIASGNDFDTFLQQGAEAITKGAIAAGKSSDEAKAEVNKLTTTFVEMQADKLSADDPRTALQFIQNHRDQFKDPEKYLQLENRVKAQAIKKTAQDVSNGVPGPGLTSNLVRGGAVDKFLDLAEAKESIGQNIEQGIVPAGGGYNPSTGTVTGPSSASGYYQITDTTWKSFAPQAGVDLAKYPRAISAPKDVQRDVARTIATTSGVQHWTNFNSSLRKAVADAGLPTSGPVAGVPTVNVTDTPLGTTAAAPPDQLIVPPPEPGEYPDAEVPGLLGELKRITQDPRIVNAPANFKADLFNAAVKETRQKYNMLYTEQTRQRQQADREQKAGIETAENDYIARLFPKDSSPSNVAVQEIANDPRLATAESKKKMISFFERETKPDPLKNISQVNSMKLFSRITEPDGTVDKITSPEPIEKAFVDGQLTRTDFSWLRDEVIKQRTASGSTLQNTKNDFLKSYETTITKSNPLMGQIDNDGMIQYGRFKYFVDQEMQKAAKAGNELDLFNPSSSSYLGRPDVIARFQKPLSESMKDTARKFAPNPAYDARTFGPTTVAPIPPPPRKSGESPEEYLKRTGR